MTMSRCARSAVCTRVGPWACGGGAGRGGRHGTPAPHYSIYTYIRYYSCAGRLYSCIYIYLACKFVSELFRSNESNVRYKYSCTAQQCRMCVRRAVLCLLYNYRNKYIDSRLGLRAYNSPGVVLSTATWCRYAGSISVQLDTGGVHLAVSVMRRPLANSTIPIANAASCSFVVSRMPLLVTAVKICVAQPR